MTCTFPLDRRIVALLFHQIRVYLAVLQWLTWLSHFHKTPPHSFSTCFVLRPQVPVVPRFRGCGRRGVCACSPSCATYLLQAAGEQRPLRSHPHHLGCSSSHVTSPRGGVTPRRAPGLCLALPPLSCWCLGNHRAGISGKAFSVLLIWGCSALHTNYCVEGSQKPGEVNPTLLLSGVETLRPAGSAGMQVDPASAVQGAFTCHPCQCNSGACP